MNKEDLSAVDWLGHLHYQICNGGMAQACFNGYIDDVIDAYGSMDAWVKALAEETNNNEKAVEAAKFIANGVSQIYKCKSCGYCGGSGYDEYEDEDEDGETITREETCSECNGEGTIDVDCYRDIDMDCCGFDDKKWDFKYYDLVDSDFIDDLTNQSHNHSVFLDMMQEPKNESYLRESKAKAGQTILNKIKKGATYDDIEDILNDWKCVSQKKVSEGDGPEDDACIEIWRNFDTNEEMKLVHNISDRSCDVLGLKKISDD